MKNREVIELYNFFNNNEQINNICSNAKFAYQLIKSKSDLEIENKNIIEAGRTAASFTPEESEIYQKIITGEIKQEDVEQNLLSNIINKHNKIEEFFNEEFIGNINKIKLEYVPNNLNMEIYTQIMKIVEE